MVDNGGGMTSKRADIRLGDICYAAVPKIMAVL